MMLNLFPFALAVTLAFSLAAYVFLKAPKRYYLKLVFIPLALAAGVMAYVAIPPLLGYSYSSKLPEKFQFLAYNVVVKNYHKESIEVWTKVNGVTRLYRIPYTEKMEEAMKNADAGAHRGGEMMLNRKHKLTGDFMKDGEDDDFEAKLQLPWMLNPKEPEEPRRAQQDPTE